MKKLYWYTAVIFMLFLVGCSSVSEVEATEAIIEQKHIEMVACYYCDREVPEEYIYTEDDKEICPICIYGDHKEMIKLLSDMPNPFSDENIIFQKTMCNNCGNDAPIDLWIEDFESICVDCATEILNDKAVNKAVWRYLEEH